MTNTYGLPAVVVSLLKHMELHKECLKWNITGGPHKMTLTLTWNFRKGHGHGRESLWDKLQRALKLNRHSEEGSGIGAVPRQLSQYLDHQSPSPKKSLLQVPQPPIQRQHSWHSNRPSPPRIAPKKQYSLGAESHYSLQPKLSPSRFSWPGDSLAPSPTRMSERAPHKHHAPLTSAPNLTRSESAASYNRAKLTYRSQDELKHSMEELVEKTKAENKEKLENVRKEWNHNMRQWPKLVRQDHLTLNSSEDLSDASDTEQNITGVNDTVQKCLTSCEKILFRNSTMIT